MKETRESTVAAILARGLTRVRQRVERAGNRQMLNSDAKAVNAGSAKALKSTIDASEKCKQGDQE